MVGSFALRGNARRDNGWAGRLLPVSVLFRRAVRGELRALAKIQAGGALANKEEGEMAKSFLVVRATVADAARRAAFDEWYHKEHLPQAMAVFNAEKGWRFWSVTEPSAHQATYQFADRAAADRAVNSAGMRALIAEFDRA